jgi:ATP-dependent Clp protease ATP-binding subunit ClpX
MFILRKKKSEVEILISGKDGYICENCVEQAHAIVKESVGSASFAPAQSIDELKKPREIKAF